MMAAGIAGVAMLGTGMLLVWQGAQIGAKPAVVAGNQPAMAPATQPNGEGWVIRPGAGLGPIQLGMTAEQVRAGAGDPDRASGFVYEYSAKGFAVGFRRDGELRVATIMAGNVAGNRVLIETFKPQTAEGGGVGSTVEQITAAYGNPEEVRVDPAIKDGSARRITYRDRGIEFVTYGGRVVWLCVRTYSGGAK
jgi:hypothetical protein